MHHQTSYKGLTDQTVLSSREKNGINKLPERRSTTKLQLLLAQFLNPLVIILGTAAVITFVLEDYIDSIAILVVLLINTGLGFFQESKAQDALKALKDIIKPQVLAWRNGNEVSLNSSDIVVGDLVKLKLGDRIPADGVIISASNLSISEAPLTGESIPVKKQPATQDAPEKLTMEQVPDVSRAYMGTTVLSGYGSYITLSVGTSTAFGKIAASLSEDHEPPTPLQKKLDHFSKQIMLLVLAVALLIFTIGVIQRLDIAEILTLSVSVAVSAIPEGLVIALTVILTLGMQRLLKRRALVRKLIVAETLGSVSTICVDKTGTLTEGTMKVIKTDLVDEKIARMSLIACNNELNAVDQATNEWLHRSGNYDEQQLFRNNKQLDELPFNSVNKFSMSLHQQQVYFVGAPDILLATSTMDEQMKTEWNHRMRAETKKGRRLIGVAYRDNDEHWQSVDSESFDSPEALKDHFMHKVVWLGYLVIEDPVRQDVKEAFKACMAAGIDVKVITGDQLETAKYVVGQVGVEVGDQEYMSGEQLSKLDSDQVAEQIKTTKLFYRTTPDQKLQIVKALQHEGEVVGMMGDGINDAPALKRADVGIVVDNATEVSKQTADIVLLDSNMKTIVAAVEEGRSIFENMKKVITYLLSDAASELILITGSMLLGLPLPLLPLQILYVNIIADGLPDLALAFEKPESGLMQDRPKSKEQPLVDREMLILILIIGGVVNIAIFAIFLIMLGLELPIEEIRSFIFAILGVDSLLYVYSVRSLRKNLWQMKITDNHTLNFAVIFGFFSIIAAFELPFIREILELRQLTWAEFLLVVVLAVVQISLIEGVKWYVRTRHLEER